jgi:superfamily I DNA/RNA helicase
VTDADGETAQRRDTVSVFNGVSPVIRQFDTESDEVREIGDWLKSLAAAGLAPHELAVVVRSEQQIARASAAVQAAELECCILDTKVETRKGHVSIMTMHLAKGLEFRAVAVMACDDEVVPLQSRIAEVGELGDLEEVYNTERHLLYVACTRARDQLAVSGVVPVSEFLDDLI